MSREKFLIIYGAPVLRKLELLEEYLRSRNIDIKRLTNRQITVMLGVPYVET
ncbi:hypothetical protein ACOL3H_06535 [Aliarcobacter butzleri]